MYKLTTKRIILWPVPLRMLREDGSGTVDETQVRIRYLLLTQEELDEYSREAIEAIAKYGNVEHALEAMTPGEIEKRKKWLKHHILGWADGEIANENGEPLEGTQENIDALLSVPYLRQDLVNGLIEASRGAPAKNSLPGPDGSPAPTVLGQATASNVN